MLIDNLKSINFDRLKDSSFVKSVFYLTIIQFTNYILPLLTLPYLVRVLGVEKFGLLAFFTAFMYYFVVLIDYGFSLTATRDVSINRNDTKKISELFNSVLIVKLTLVVVSSFFLFILYLTFPLFKSEQTLFALSFCAVVFQSLLPVWFFQGLEVLKTITVLNTLSKLLYAVCVFVFVISPADYFLVPFFTALGFFLSCCISYYIVIKKFSVSVFIPSRYDVFNVLQNGWYVFLSQMKTTIFSSTNVVILGFFSGPSAVGIFSSAEKLIRAIASLQTPITTALFPIIAVELKTNKDMALKRLKKIILLGCCIYIFSLGGMFLYSKEIIVFIYSDTLLEAVWVFEVLLIIPLLIFVNNMLGTQILLNIGREKCFFWALFFSAVFSVVLCTVLTHIYSIQGTAISLLLTEVLIVLIFILLTRKELITSRIN